MNKEYCVYIHRNKLDNKVYVGMTSNIRKRWNGKEKYSTQPFGEIVKEIGWNNFEHIIVAFGLTREEASKLEQETIKRYDSMNPNCGYNHNSGGKSGWEISARCREQLRRSHIDFFKDPKNRKDQSERISEYYRKHPELRKPVIQYSKDGELIRIFGSAWETRLYGFDASHVKACCKGHRKTTGGYIWKYQNEFAEV